MHCASMIKAVREAKGDMKIHVIRRHSDNNTFVKLLQYTYHPMLKFGMSKPPIASIQAGGGVRIEHLPELFPLLDSLADGVLSGNAAKSAVFQASSKLNVGGQEVLAMVIKKDLRCGISITTINKAIPGLIPVFGIMKAKSFSGKLHPGGSYMSLKLDGLRCVYQDGEMFTSGGHIIRGVDHLIADLPACGDHSFDGEIMVPGSDFNESSGKIRSFKDCPDAVYNVFDVPSIQEPFKYRYKALVNFMYDAGPRVKLVKHVLTNDVNKVHYTMHKAISSGYEGLVLKDPEHFYAEKRSSDWLKLKLTRSEDLVIVGFFEGEGRLEGTLGGIIVERGKTLVRVGSGFSDHMRDLIWRKQEHYDGMIAEVAYHEELPSGSLRHPRFKRFRNDK